MMLLWIFPRKPSTILPDRRILSIEREVEADLTLTFGIISWRVSITSFRDADLCWAVGGPRLWRAFIAVPHLRRFWLSTTPMGNRCLPRNVRTLPATQIGRASCR